MEQQKGSTSKEMIWALRWSVALRTFYRQILSLLYSSFPFGNFRPRLVRALLVGIWPSLYAYFICIKYEYWWHTYMHFLQDMTPPILPTCRPMWNENIGPEEWGQRRCFTTRETGNTGKMKGKYWNKDFGNTGKFSLLKFELLIWWNQSLNGTESYVSQVGLISTTLRGPARHSPRLSRWRPSTSNAFERECLKHFKEVVNSWTLVVRS